VGVKKFLKDSTKAMGDPLSYATDGQYGASIDHNPISAYKRGKKSGASRSERAREIIDPGRVLGGSLPLTEKQLAKEKAEHKAWVAKVKARKRKKKPIGMKAGGRTRHKHSGNCCRGMGAAIRGGKFRKDG